MRIIYFQNWIKSYLSDFKNIISRRQYNDRRKLLFEKVERVRKLLSERLNSRPDVFAIDSVPIEICKPSREKRNKMVKKLCIIHQRIETVFSQLCDQFMIQRNYAKSFTGFKSRILAKVSGFAILQFLNKFIYNQPVGRVKHALAN